MNNILSCLEGAKTVMIAGHTRPDGDCVGACMGLWHYIRDNYPYIQAVSDWNLFRTAIRLLRVLNKLSVTMKMIEPMTFLSHWMPVTKKDLPVQRSILIRQSIQFVLIIISAIRDLRMKILCCQMPALPVKC